VGVAGTIGGRAMGGGGAAASLGIDCLGKHSSAQKTVFRGNGRNVNKIMDKQVPGRHGGLIVVRSTPWPGTSATSAQATTSAQFGLVTFDSCSPDCRLCSFISICSLYLHAVCFLVATI
jgi:hypothetical protein